MESKELKRAWAEIHLDRLKKNVRKCRSLVPDGCEMMCVVKANCYGHGIDRIIPCLQDEMNIKWFAVSNFVEARQLRELGVDKNILILGYTPAEYAAALCEYDIAQAVTEYDYAAELSGHCPHGDKVRVHIAVDTGMTRIGLRERNTDDVCNIIERIMDLPGLTAEGVFTHLAVADSDDIGDIDYTDAQISRITKVGDKLKSRGRSIEYLHFLNSAGAAYHSDPRSSLVRIGIMLYGLHPNVEMDIPVSLEPVMELKACVSQVKTVEPGVSVSYGRRFVTQRETVVATVTIGYADGYPRLLSDKASVLIRGRRAAILGRICMDQLMIDVTDIPGVCVGDVVTLFGSDGDETISVDELAASYGSIGYEIVCGIGSRVPRVFIE